MIELVLPKQTIEVIIKKGIKIVVIFNYEYSSKNDIIRANRPVASDRANPRIAYENSCQSYLMVYTPSAHFPTENEQGRLSNNEIISFVIVSAARQFNI